MGKAIRSKFVVDTEDLSPEECEKLEEALVGLAESDCPLLVEVLVTDEEEIRRLNREQRGIDRVTDVLSFPSMDDVKGVPVLAEEHGDELDEEDRLFLGSVVICEKRAREQAEEYGHSYARELFYLAVHGVLHCLGYDHESEEERAEMREKEEEVMRKLGLPREGGRE